MKTAEVARKGYEERSKTKAEYKDDPEVLKEKVKVLAKLLRDSGNCVFYSGAGISTGAGVPDYASKNKPTKKLAGGYRSAEPTMAHHSATTLFNKGHIKHWLQQNHDGLAQKAGMPNNLKHLNEIHGGWYDPANPVVKMDGSLKKENFAKFNEWVEKTDFVIAVGSSMVGMSSDGIVEEVISNKGFANLGQGVAIINN